MTLLTPTFQVALVFLLLAKPALSADLFNQQQQAALSNQAIQAPYSPASSRHPSHFAELGLYDLKLRYSNKNTELTITNFSRQRHDQWIAANLNNGQTADHGENPLPQHGAEFSTILSHAWQGQLAQLPLLQDQDVAEHANQSHQPQFSAIWTPAQQTDASQLTTKLSLNFFFQSEQSILSLTRNPVTISHQLFGLLGASSQPTSLRFNLETQFGAAISQAAIDMNRIALVSMDLGE